MKIYNKLITCIFILSLLGCSSNVRDTGNISNWDDFTPVPYNGYICGFEETSTMIQLPAFLPMMETEELPIDNISEVNLIGDDGNMKGTFYDLLEFRHNLEYNYSLTTLTFFVDLPTAGEYMVDKLQIKFKDGIILERDLGEVIFIVSEPSQQEINPSIFPTKFMLNQTDSSSIKIAYTNTSQEQVIISSLSYSDDIYLGLSIKKYIDFELETLEEGLWIPPGETRTFLFTFINNEKYFKSEEEFLFLLPFLYYSSNGVEMKIPSLSQAMVIQSLFYPEYVLELLDWRK